MAKGAQLKWPEFKQTVIDRSLSVQWRIVKQVYWLMAVDGPFSFECVIRIEDPASADQSDFETNYKNAATTNTKLESPKDSDGSPLQRVKVTTTGWAYQLHSIEGETSKLNSIVANKADNTAWNFTTTKHYKLVDEVETLMVNPTQEQLNADCIKTVVEWEPTFDYEIIGGSFNQLAVPAQDVRIWVVGVPDVPAESGGNKLFVSSVNLRYAGLEEGVRVDGRAPKYLTYNSTYHTNKLQIILRHPAGFNHKFCFIFEIFKA